LELQALVVLEPFEFRHTLVENPAAWHRVEHAAQRDSAWLRFIGIDDEARAPARTRDRMEEEPRLLPSGPSLSSSSNGLKPAGSGS
jgi:hypothetical protein